VEFREEIIEYAAGEFRRLLERDVAETSEWSKGPEDSLVHYAFRFAGVLSADAFDFGFVVAVVFSGQEFDLAIVGLRSYEHSLAIA